MISEGMWGGVEVGVVLEVVVVGFRGVGAAPDDEAGGGEAMVGRVLAVGCVFF